MGKACLVLCLAAALAVSRKGGKEGDKDVLVENRTGGGGGRRARWRYYCPQDRSPARDSAAELLQPGASATTCAPFTTTAAQTPWSCA